MSIEFENESVVTDNTFQFMKPIVKGNAKVELGSVGYHYFKYVENGGYSCNENYWCPLYENDPEFDSDEKAIKHLDYLREKYPNIKIKLIVHKRLDTREVIE